MSETDQYTRDVVRQGKVPVSTKILNGFGGLVESVKMFAFSTFLLLYYSQILGLRASLVAVVLAIALICDAISDPIVGSISDNLKSKMGRRHPFMLGAALPMGITMYFLFSPPEGLSDTFLLLWLLFFTIMLRTAYTFFVVPWHAIAAEYSSDYVERTTIISFRALVAWTGGITFQFLAWTYLFANTKEYPEGQLNPEYYSTFGLVVGLLMMTCAVVAAIGTIREIPYLLQPVQSTPRFSFRRTLDEMLLAFGNANFRRLFILFVMFSGLGGIGGVFDIYMNTYFWEFTSNELRWFGLGIVGGIIAPVVAPFIQKYVEKKTLFQYFFAFYMVGAILKVCFRFWDIWPDNGDPMLLKMLVVQFVFQAFFITICAIMIASLIADLMDEQELETDRRQEGMFSSAISFSVKATASGGLILGGLLLDFVIAFPTQAEVGAIDQDTLFRLAIIDGVAVPLLFFIPIYLMSRITMTRERLAEVQSALEARHASTTGSEVSAG